MRFMGRWILFLFMAAVLATPAHADEADGSQDISDFSPWLRAAADDGGEDDFGAYLRSVKAQGLYVNAVEGRWHNNWGEFRVRTARRPTDCKLHRYWWFGMSEAFYEQELEKLTVDDTFQCVWSQHFTDGNGNERYQMVFLKFVPLAPAAP